MALWVSQAPPRRDRHFQAGVVAYHAADYHAAIESLNAAIAADSEFAPAYLARGCAALLQHDVDNYRGWLDAAFRDLTLANRYQPHPEIISARAYCVMKKGDFEMAAKEFDFLLRQEIIGPEVYNNLGYCYEKMVATAARKEDPSEADQLYVEAERLYRQALDAAPDAIAPRVNLGLILHRKYQSTKEPDAAREGLTSMRHALRLGADDFITYFYAAKLAAILVTLDGGQELVEESLDYLSAALERGRPTGGFAPTTTPPFNVLADHPRLVALLRREPAKKAARGPERLMAPAVIASHFDLLEKS
jgi:tetratricopeptide (TPR) repeat protein